MNEESLPVWAPTYEMLAEDVCRLTEELEFVAAQRDALIVACKFGDGHRDGPAMLRYVADILDERGPSDYAHVLRGKAMLEQAAITQINGTWAEREAGVQIDVVLATATALRETPRQRPLVDPSTVAPTLQRASAKVGGGGAL